MTNDKTPRLQCGRGKSEGEFFLQKPGKIRFDYNPTHPAGVRREKAALFQWVQTPPGNRSSRKQPEQLWR